MIRDDRSIESSFTQLCRLAREEQILQSSLALLEWDQNTKLPEAGVAYRAEQITFLSGELHRHATAPIRGELLDLLVDSELAADRHGDAGCTIRELKRRFDRKTKLPKKLVEAIARQSSLGQQAWLEARRANDFSRFAPHLEEIFQLKREEADAIGFAEQLTMRVDDYEPGAVTSELTKVLSNLKDELVPLIQHLQQGPREPEIQFLGRRFPIDQQRALVTEVASRMGFDFQRGRLDETAHPFCTEIGRDDVRITTRYDERGFSPAFFGTLHEAGRGIYEQGLRSEQPCRAVADSCRGGRSDL